jgi:hypothetical protein
MLKRISARYSSAKDFQAHLREAQNQGALFVPTTQSMAHLLPLEKLVLVAVWEEDGVEAGTRVEAELLQLLEGSGLVLRIVGEPEDLLPEPMIQPVDEPNEEPAITPQRPAPAGSSPLSWSMEKLQTDWDTLQPAERIRVARFGNRGARGVVLRSNDRSLHIHLLSNPHIGVEEVASLASNAALDPNGLRRIIANSEWLRSIEVTRNLVSNPKLPMPEVERLLRTMPRDELLRLTRSGRARALVKQAAAKRLKSFKG